VFAASFLFVASLVNVVFYAVGNGLHNVRYVLPAVYLVFAGIVRETSFGSGLMHGWGLCCRLATAAKKRRSAFASRAIEATSRSFATETRLPASRLHKFREAMRDIFCCAHDAGLVID